MAKAKNTQAANNAVKAEQVDVTKITLSELKRNRNVWYKIHVLIYDLCNVKNDRSSESRIERTVDELYISEPYFTNLEAAIIKATLVEIAKIANDIMHIEITLDEEVNSATKEFKTIEEANKERLSNFYIKRKASRDF